MKIVDAHFHWYAKPVIDMLVRAGAKRQHFPPVWYDLDGLLARLDGVGDGGSEAVVICSAGIASEYFARVPLATAVDAARAHNEALAEAQARTGGRLRGAAVVPLQDTETAIEHLRFAVEELGIRAGVSLPGSIGADEHVDAARLEDFYDTVEELGVPLLLHPTDATFGALLADYDGALHGSLGRVVDVSVTAMRLVLSGIMERHPRLTVVVSHGGGALPYQAGRMDKNASIASLPEPPSAYLRRMYTDTVCPQPETIRFAVDFFGADHVLFGTDCPCWEPKSAREVVDAAGLTADVAEKVMSGNARRVFRLEA